MTRSHKFVRRNETISHKLTKNSFASYRKKKRSTKETKMDHTKYIDNQLKESPWV